MAETRSQIDTAIPGIRLHAPGGVFWMFVSAPFMIALGAFITVAMQPYVTVKMAEREAVLMAWVGSILLCLGLVLLVSAIVLVGVRSILQQQTELLRGAPPERHGG